MKVVMELYEYKTMAMELMELGAAALVMRMTPAKDLISQREAYREFGEARVKGWSSMIAKKRIGTASRSKVLYSRAELLALDRGERHIKVINKKPLKKKPIKQNKNEHLRSI